MYILTYKTSPWLNRFVTYFDPQAHPFTEFRKPTVEDATIGTDAQKSSHTHQIQTEDLSQISFPWESQYTTPEQL